MVGTIDHFVWPHDYLSNFHSSPIIYEGVVYPTVEHAFQAAKTELPHLREQIAVAKTPGVAKRIGRSVDLRSDWESVKDSVMHQLLVIKFSDTDMATLLNTTGSATLVEDNDWHDQYWGNCTCPRHSDTPGTNRLGELLMQVRESNRITQ